MLGVVVPAWSRRRFHFCMQQPEAKRQEYITIAGAEEPKVADANEAFRQDMKQKTPQEFVNVQGH